MYQYTIILEPQSNVERIDCSLDTAGKFAPDIGEK